ncbi:MAG: ubiquinone anaerobic biosynthesis accessory factor UbiT [Metallibacterium sp.]
MLNVEFSQARFEQQAPAPGLAGNAHWRPVQAGSVELRAVRSLIDRVDEMFLVLLAGRRRLVRRAMSVKHRAGLPGRSLERERQVHDRAQAFGAKLALSKGVTRQLTELLIADACALQGLSSTAEETTGDPSSLHDSGSSVMLRFPYAENLLRLLPPPARLRTPLRWVLPPPLLRALLRRMTLRVMAAPLANGAFDDLRGRRLGVEVTDLKLRWVVEIGARDLHVQVPGENPESTVRGSATDLLLLASRLEDADTLFFQRRLQLVGDTELGLQVRNLLDQLPWETIPLDIRVFLNRGARFARLARAVHCGKTIA